MRETSLRLADRGRRASGRPAVKGLRRVEEGESLTRRERQILDFFAQGLGTAAIADRLAISPTTVRNHSQHVLAKLRVHSRLQAVARGYAHGLIPRPAAAARNEEDAKS